MKTVPAAVHVHQPGAIAQKVNGFCELLKCLLSSLKIFFRINVFNMSNDG